MPAKETKRGTGCTNLVSNLTRFFIMILKAGIFDKNCVFWGIFHSNVVKEIENEICLIEDQKYSIYFG